MGEPKVKKDMYINHKRIFEVAMPKRSPRDVHTPNALNSIKSLILYHIV